MLLIIGIALFLLGCCLDCTASEFEQRERNAERRHKEQMKTLAERNNTVKHKKVTRRRIIKDASGMVIGEELIEEIDI